MTRPKHVEGQPTARQRMEEAFWAMLAEMPYHKMTSREICSRSGVSHNSFYYHFENLDDMAQRALDGLFTPELPLALLSMVDASRDTQPSIESVPDLQQRIAKMRLLISSGSPDIVGLVRDKILKAWLQTIGVGEDTLSTEDRLDLTFIVGGITALLGSDIIAPEASAISSFAERETGRGVIHYLASLAQRHG